MSASLLFAPPRAPYYIYAPDYRESSAGVWVLHYLCHALNLRGHEAYVASAKVTNPKLRTPQLTQETADRHRRLGLEPIAVYPETVSGNPLNARVCVRYILNLIGLLTGKPLGEGPDDLFFYYSEQFLGDRKKEEADFLLVPSIDLELFKPEPGRVRDKAYLYHNRFPRERIDLSLFPPDVEILSNETPLTLAELADKLKSARVLYSYEMSNTCSMAMAVGCPVIYRPEGGLTAPPGRYLVGMNGHAMADEEGGLERAAATVAVAHPVYEATEETFWQQLDAFIEKTQEAAKRIATMPKRRRVAVCALEVPANACPQIRLIAPFSLLSDHWELVWGLVNRELNLATLRSADVILLNRFTPGLFSPEILKAIFDLGKPVIYESDDLFTEIPDGLPNAEFMRRGRPGIEHAIRHANAVIVSTPYLAEKHREMNPNVHVLLNFVDFDRFYRPVPLQAEGPVTIGLVGTSLMPYNFALVDAALRDLCARYPGKIRLRFIGHSIPSGWEAHPAVEFQPVLHEYQAYVQWLLDSELDIAVVPLVGDSFNNSKSVIKWLEYSAAGVATIFSDVPTYQTAVDHGRNGMLAKDSPAEWLAAIETLVANPAMRRQIARTAQAEVRKHFSLRDNVYRYHQTYLRCIGANTEADAVCHEDIQRVPAVLILDGEGSAEKVRYSMEALSASPYRQLPVIVLTTQSGALPEWTDSLRFVQAGAAEYAESVEQLCALADFDWAVILEAGTAFLPGGANGV